MWNWISLYIDNNTTLKVKIQQAVMRGFLCSIWFTHRMPRNCRVNSKLCYKSCLPFISWCFICLEVIFHINYSVTADRFSLISIWNRIHGKNRIWKYFPALEWNQKIKINRFTCMLLRLVSWAVVWEERNIWRVHPLFGLGFDRWKMKTKVLQSELHRCNWNLTGAVVYKLKGQSFCHIKTFVHAEDQVLQNS